MEVIVEAADFSSRLSFHEEVKECQSQRFKLPHFVKNHSGDEE